MSLCKEVTKEVTQCEFSYLPSSFERGMKKTSERYEKGKVRSLLIFASYRLALKKPVLVDTPYMGGCGIPQPSPLTRKRKSLITVIVAIGATSL